MSSAFPTPQRLAAEAQALSDLLAHIGHCGVTEAQAADLLDLIENSSTAKAARSADALLANAEWSWPEYEQRRAEITRAQPRAKPTPGRALNDYVRRRAHFAFRLKQLEDIAHLRPIWIFRASDTILGCHNRHLDGRSASHTDPFWTARPLPCWRPDCSCYIESASDPSAMPRERHELPIGRADVGIRYSEEAASYDDPEKVAVASEDVPAFELMPIESSPIIESVIVNDLCPLAVEPQPITTYGIDMSQELSLVQQAIRAGDFDAARMWLQKAAYAVTRPEVAESDKAEVKRLMTEFARIDPLYRDTMAKLVPLVRANPGIMQSDLTRGHDEQSAELLRYVLYFAAELGELVRFKKGRSYQLYLPGTTVDHR